MGYHENVTNWLAEGKPVLLRELQRRYPGLIDIVFAGHEIVPKFESNHVWGKSSQDCRINCKDLSYDLRYLYRLYDSKPSLLDECGNVLILGDE